MASNSGRRSGSSGRSSGRKRVVIGAEETTRVSYNKDRPQVESERKRAPKRTPKPPTTERAGARTPRPTSGGRRVASEKRDDRDRRRKEIGRRRILLGVLLVVLVVAAGWGAVTLWQAPIFTIDTVDVTGVSHLKASEITTAAAVRPDDTLLRIDTAAVAQRIEASPWVDSVSVTRSFPHTLSVAVTERAPAAFIDAGVGGPWLMSKDGVWIAKRTTEATSTLPIIKDIPALKPAPGANNASPELTNALAVATGLSPGLAAKVKWVSAPTVEKTMLVLKNDIQVFIGSAEDLAKKDLIARGILAREKNIVYVNVRVTDRPTWRGLDPAN